MKKMLQKFSPVPSFRNACIGVTGFAVGNSAFAADLDPAAVVTAIESSQGKAVTVGQAVVAAVVSLVIVGIIIALVRKV